MVALVEVVALLEELRRRYIEAATAMQTENLQGKALEYEVQSVQYSAL